MLGLNGVQDKGKSMAFHVKAIQLEDECQTNGPHNDLSSFSALCTLTQNKSSVFLVITSLLFSCKL